jgi:chromate transporter
MIVTWFTFLPSFMFILAGGPLVESTHNDLKFTAPLTAITAAVVGVIANLALFFAYNVFWLAGTVAHVDWVSVAIAVAAAGALFRFKLSVIYVIGGCDSSMIWAWLAYLDEARMRPVPAMSFPVAGDQLQRAISSDP